MIVFHGDKMVPPPLCTLLYSTVPEEYHLPVIFTNRKHHEMADRSLGFHRRTGVGPLIVINLHQIWRAAIWSNTGSMEFRLWHELLNTCYHEFGHEATLVFPDDDHYEDHRCWERSERKANLWANRQIMQLTEHDPRLGQPRVVRGYFGARLVRHIRDRWETNNQNPGWDPSRVAWLKDWRCYKTGTQLTSGDVLDRLRVRRCSKSYALLRKVSVGLGVNYTDGARRNHKLYNWGDLEELAERLNRIGSARAHRAEVVR